MGNSSFFGELSSSWDTLCRRTNPILLVHTRSFSPKHEATNRQDRPTWAVFSCSSDPRPGTIGNHRRRSSLIYLYITRSNSPRSVHVLRSSSWLANVRRRPNRVTWLEYGLRRRERSLSFRREWASSWDSLFSGSRPHPVRGKES